MMKPQSILFVLTLAITAVSPATVVMAQIAQTSPTAIVQPAPSAGDVSVTATILSGKPAPPDALTRIKQVHDDLQSSEAAGKFDSYKKTFLDATTNDFDFKNSQKTEFTRDAYLTNKEAVMKSTDPGTVVTWKVDSATKSPVDTSVDVTASRDLTGTITDPAGTYGAKGLTHKVQTTSEYYEHWVQMKAGDSNSWKMDDMGATKVTLTVDGKVWNPPTQKEPTYNPQRQNTQQRQRKRGRRSNNYYF